MSELLRQAGESNVRQLPRMAPRYRTDAATVTVHLPARRWLSRRSKMVQCDLIDLSIDGALIAFPAGSVVDNGIRVDVDFDGREATVGIRHRELGLDGRLQCGVAFRTTTPAFDEVLNATIAAAIDDPRRHDAWRIS